MKKRQKTKKLTIPVATGQAFSGTRVEINLNGGVDSCPFGLVGGSVFVGDKAADEVRRGGELDSDGNKYRITDTGQLIITLGDLAAENTKVVTFYVTTAEDNENFALDAASLYKNHHDFIMSLPITISTPIALEVEEGGKIASENLTTRDGSTYVRDTVKYSVTAYNNSTSMSSLWEDVTVTDTLPKGMDFVAGSVAIGGAAAAEGTGEGQYTYNEPSRELTVHMGNIAYSSECTVIFNATVDSDAYDETIINTAAIIGTDKGIWAGIAAVTVSDDGFTVEAETVLPAAVTVIYNPSGGTYSGTFGGNGHADSGVSISALYTVRPLSEVCISRDGYTLREWNAKPDGSGTGYQPGEAIYLIRNAIFYAVWTPVITDYYSVTYISGQGCFSNGLTHYKVPCIQYGQAHAIQSQEALGLTANAAVLLGWHTEQRGGGRKYEAGDAAKITENLCLYAHWQTASAITSVIYDANNDAFGYERYLLVSDLPAGDEYAVLENMFTSEGSAFTGWNTAADGTGTDYAPGDTFAAAGVITLYAKWQAMSAPNVYAVTYSAGGGVGSYTDTGLVSDVKYTVKEPSDTGVSRGGYIFKGWNTAAGGTETSYTAGDTFTVANSVTLYAQWEKVSFSGVMGSLDTISAAKTKGAGSAELWQALLYASFAGATGLLWAAHRKKRRGRRR